MENQSIDNQISDFLIDDFRRVFLPLIASNQIPNNPSNVPEADDIYQKRMFAFLPTFVFDSKTELWKRIWFKSYRVIMMFVDYAELEQCDAKAIKGWSWFIRYI